MDLEKIMQAAQNMQAELTKAQANLDTIEVEGAAGGGLVTVRATAKGRILGVAIDDALMQPSEKQMLEDLIAAARQGRRAERRADEQDDRRTAAAARLQAAVLTIRSRRPRDAPDDERSVAGWSAIRLDLSTRSC